jgi:uncharacterized protein YecT (DUF1311 family)
MAKLLISTFCLFIFVFSPPAKALDCSKAVLPVEKTICATPNLKNADKAMSEAYFSLLRATTDPEFHEALIRSQRRWLESRSHGVDKFGAARTDPTDDRVILLNFINRRAEFLRSDAPIEEMRRQRFRLMADGSGSFAGHHSTWCFFEPPP